MPLLDIHHVAIKTEDVEATNSFYVDLLGMKFAPRPPFDFPGSWLSIGQTMVHVMGGHAAYDVRGEFVAGSAALDHIAIEARDFDEMKQRFIDNDVEWRQNGVPEAKLWQLFVKDPNGIIIELNFDTTKEPKGARGFDGENLYEPGQF